MVVVGERVKRHGGVWKKKKKNERKRRRERDLNESRRKEKKVDDEWEKKKGWAQCLRWEGFYAQSSVK